ncbi:MAG: alanine dehydrogenase [Alphaproteobacteria bacterium]|nr:alanine dehydrogenase [Alphaproteobacteria bacterium]
MRVGVPREVKNHEYRVGLTPELVAELVTRGHVVLVQATAGLGAGFSDQAYAAVGARIVPQAENVFREVDLIVKVKEPQSFECAWLGEGQTLFTYLHLAADPQLTEALQRSKATCIAYETVTDGQGGLPLLRPMSEVAGRMSIQVGAYFLQAPNGGRGVLLGGCPGVEKARVVILGAGVAGQHAAQMAVGMRAKVTLLDISPSRLAQVDRDFSGAVETRYASRSAIAQEVAVADLVIGAALVPGAPAPKLVTRSMLASMKPGAVLVDIAIDQGGCFETSRPTSHAAPSFELGGIVHYCVTNMPGAVPRSSTLALNSAISHHLFALADKGTEAALKDDSHLRAGLNIDRGTITYPQVALAFGAGAQERRAHA